MKQILLTLALSIISANLYADVESYSAIQQYLTECRQESNIPYVKSSSHSGYYYVGKTNGLYTVKVDVQLRYPSYFSHQEFVQARQIFEAVKDWIRHYYTAYGLYLEIHFEHAQYDRSSSNPHPTPKLQSFVVYVRNHTGSHMKELFWGVNPDWAINDQAKVIAHEFSHLLRLNDEYLRATGAQTPEEEAGYEDDSLMKNIDSPNPRLYLRHIKKILEPICQPASTIVAQESMTDFSFPRSWNLSH